MRKTCRLLSVALLAGGLSTAALAHDEGRSEEPKMKGTISKIDPASGKIELKTDQGPAQVYFAPDSIKSLKEGDQVTLELETSKGKAKEMGRMSKKEKSTAGTNKGY